MNTDLSIIDAANRKAEEATAYAQQYTKAAILEEVGQLLSQYGATLTQVERAEHMPVAMRAYRSGAWFRFTPKGGGSDQGWAGLLHLLKTMGDYSPKPFWESAMAYQETPPWWVWVRSWLKKGEK